MNNQQCPNCRYQNAPGMSFCAECGENLFVSGIGSPTNFSGESAPTVFSGASASNAPPKFEPVFSVPPQMSPQKNSNAFKILLLAAGGGVLLVLAAGIAGVMIYLNYSKGETDKSAVNTAVNQENSNAANRRTLVSGTNSANVSTNNTSKSTSGSAQTLDDFERSKIGGYSLTSTTMGNPASDGFSGAIEEKQYKYANGGGTFAIHFTAARYASAAQAQQALRNSMDEFKSKGLKTTEIVPVAENDGTIDGIHADLIAKNGLLARCWTKNEFLVRALGEKKDVDSFFTAY
ncbi:MAG: hypothetical protein ACR2N3_05585 [Pyrinomonadaceae bacterium]